MPHIADMAGTKAHSSAAQFLRSRLADRRLDSSSKKQSMENRTPKNEQPQLSPAKSLDASAQVPLVGTSTAKNDGEPRVRDFWDNKSRKSIKSSATTREHSPAAPPKMPTDLSFDRPSFEDEDAAPAPPDFTRRGGQVSSRPG
jgi:hypothetical protein